MEPIPILRILNSDGSQAVVGNDNWNGSTYVNCDIAGPCPGNGDPLSGLFAPLASKLVFTASTQGTYYVEISTSSLLPPSAGRYGTYTLTFSSP